VPDPSDIEAQRLAKLRRLKEQGIDPYPARWRRTHTSRQAIEVLGDGQAADVEVSVAGRVTAFRAMGKAAFLDLRDGSGKLQLHIRRDAVGDSAYALLDALDLGDFLGATGVMFRTRTGEPTVAVSRYTILAKALLPLPEKWHGLRDPEKRYRQRYLDLIANQEVRQLFLLRSRVVSAIRRFQDGRGFIEVETPVLVPVAAGAHATPFVTHHEALDRDLYLRIATELYLKRLIIGGFDKVYELGRVFRNEGISFKHNPEFTLLESYEAYASYLDVMAMVEELMAFATKEALGTTQVKVPANPRGATQLPSPLQEAMSQPGSSGSPEGSQPSGGGTGGVPQFQNPLPGKEGGKGDGSISPGITSETKHVGRASESAPSEPAAGTITIDFSRPWRRVSFRDALREASGIDIADPRYESADALRAEARRLGVQGQLEAMSPAQLYDKLLSHFVEPTLVQPTFVLDYPAAMSPLAKRKPDDPRFVERFEGFAGGIEVANSFSELNDPLDQIERFREQERWRSEFHDVEADRLDDDFVTALKHGMPPTGGLGIGIDRLIMLLSGHSSIRETILFPQLRTLAVPPDETEETTSPKEE
jgi:lysyl-tRNA synthetase class 2